MREAGSIRPKLTYANVVSTLCLFLLLGGGAYAGSKLAKNSVGTKQIRKGAVTEGKISASAQAALKGNAGTPGVSHGFQANGSSASVSASTFGTTVVPLQLPPGNYFATSTVLADAADGLAGGISCRLIDGNGGFESSATTRSQDLPATGTSENFTLVGEFVVTAGEALNLQCYRYGASGLVRAVRANIVAAGISDVSGANN